MWNITQAIPEYASQASDWETRVKGLLDAVNHFLVNGTNGQPVLTEVQCEQQNTCNKDQTTFKGYLARWMRATAQVAPFASVQVSSSASPLTSLPKCFTDAAQCSSRRSRRQRHRARARHRTARAASRAVRNVRTSFPESEDLFASDTLTR